MKATASQIQAELLRRSFYKFVKAAWPEIETTTYVDGWHIELICKALEYAYGGYLFNNNLYINVPPSHMKTLLCAVFFPAWVWAKDPGKRFLCISYSEILENKASRKCRNLIDSDWYKNLFMVDLAQDSNKVVEFSNTKGGIRYSVGITGTLTGRHADFIIMDDLLSASDVVSEAEMDKVNRIYDDVIPSRKADPKKSVQILIGQRLSRRDVFGHIDSTGEPFERIILPAEYEGVRYTSAFPELNDPRVTEGELIWPKRMGYNEIELAKQKMSTLGYSGQYQQRPTPAGGYVYQREWFARRVLLTDTVGGIGARIISVDTSFGTNARSDFSSIMIGEMTYKAELFIRSLVRGKWEFPQLVKAIEEEAIRWHYRLRRIIIESKASGISLIQTLNQSSDVVHDLEKDLGMKRGMLIYPVNPADNKTDRAALTSIWCEKGMVLLPPPDPAFPWLGDFEDELFSFPNGTNDDMVDCFSQLINFASKKLSEGLQMKEKL